MSTGHIPWSAERERQLRQRILVLHSAIWVAVMAGLASQIAGAVLPRHRLLFLGGVLLLVPIFLLPKLASASYSLGREEMVWRGVHIPGSGMLQNKPRETSRLTKWIQHKLYPGMMYEQLTESAFRCNCGQSYQLGDLKWVANLLEYEEKAGEAAAEASAIGQDMQAVDPEGGRYVLICSCGIGHYMLSHKDGA